MKKILFLFAFLVLGVTAKAQYVSNLDEIELLGTWNVTTTNGEIMVSGHPERVASITFNDGQNSFMSFESNNSTIIPVYTVGGTATGRYTLHLIRRYEYNSDYTSLSSLNFEVYQFGSNTMTLRTYDKSVTIKLEKQSASSVSSVKADAKTTGKSYTLDGMTATDTTKGIIIQNGKKKIRK